MDQHDTFQAAIQAGRSLTQVHLYPGCKPVVSIPGDQKVVELPKDKQAAPRFLVAAPYFIEVGAFIAYVNTFKTAQTRIFFTADGKMEAVIDYHGPGAPAHGTHVAFLCLEHSPEWDLWTAANGKQMGQRDFAEFIEDNAADLLNPSPADMLEVATSLHATSGATFRRAMNLANGQVQMAWDENVEAKVAGGTKDVPASFTVGLRPFMGCARYQVECRLRYRIERGSVVFFFKALRLDPILEGVLTGENGITARVRDETGITPALGKGNPAAFKEGV